MSRSDPRQHSPHDPFAPARERMVQEQLSQRGIRNETVLSAMGRVPRHAFVPESAVRSAYGDHPMSIGFGQTISQPYMVGLMTQELALSSSHRVLEIGTGSGYQTAVLSQLADHVHTVERIAKLSHRAQAVLLDQDRENITFHVGDGSLGLATEAPFDRIIVTAGAPAVPQSLKQQLADPGLMVIPVGRSFLQTLLVVHRSGSEFKETRVCDCVFVKLKGEEGWRIED